MTLSSLLTLVNIPEGELPLVAIDPATRFAIVATERGPERVDSAFRKICVPVRDWQAQRIQENDEIIGVLCEASAANPMKVAAPAVINGIFWAKNRGWRALIGSPDLFGKVLIPDGLLVVPSELVPEDRLVLVGPNAGFLVKQGARRGVVSHNKQGLMQIQFSSV